MLRKIPAAICRRSRRWPTSAIICGRVIVEDFVYVGPYAVIRADELNAAGDMDRSSSARTPYSGRRGDHSKSGAAVTMAVTARSPTAPSSTARVASTIGCLSVSTACCSTATSVRLRGALQRGGGRRDAAGKPLYPSTERVGPDSDLSRYRRSIAARCSFRKKWPPQRRVGARLPGITQ